MFSEEEPGELCEAKKPKKPDESCSTCCMSAVRIDEKSCPQLTALPVHHRLQAPSSRRQQREIVHDLFLPAARGLFCVRSSSKPKNASLFYSAYPHSP
jgi:hypothetical protein